MKFCPNCEGYHAVQISNTQETYTVHGREITVPVTVELCINCGQEIGSDAHDQEILDAVNAKYRREVDNQ